MKRTGELLLKAREERGLSLNEIALSLKINSKVLSAIENGDLSKLPAKTFLRGFVQSYSNYLKLDTEEILNLFNEEMGAPRPSVSTENAEANAAASEKEAAAPLDQPLRTETPAMAEAKGNSSALEHGLSSIEDSSRTKILILSFFCVMLVLLIFGTKKIIDRYQRESVPPAEVAVTAPLPEAEPVAAPKETPVSPAATTEVKPTTAPEQKSTVMTPNTTPPAPAPAAVPAPTPVAPKPAPAPVAAPVVAPVPPPAPKPPPAVAATPAVVPPVAAPKPAEKPAEKPVEKPVAKNIELIIEALDQVDIEYSSSTGSSQKLRLNADQVHTIRSPNGLRISVSNGGAVNLTLNGKDLGVPGELGKSINLRY